MKKYLMLTAITLFMTSNVFADGCMTLKNTSWHGQVKLQNETIVPINVRINQVTDNRGTYNITGTINGETLDGQIACMEWVKGNISQLSLSSAHYWVSVRKFNPNAKNPNKLTDIFGTVNNDVIYMFDEAGSYLIKS